MKGKPKPFLGNSEIDELCERLIYEYMGDDGAGKPVDIIGFTTGWSNVNKVDRKKKRELSTNLFSRNRRKPIVMRVWTQNVVKSVNVTKQSVLQLG